MNSIHHLPLFWATFSPEARWTLTQSRLRLWWSGPHTHLPENVSTIPRLLMVNLALEEWRHWLEGAEHPFIIWTDHKNLTYLRTTKMLNTCQICLSLLFGQLNWNISYLLASWNENPEALSLQYSENASQQKPQLILPSSCTVGSLTWDIEETIQWAARQTRPRLSPHPLHRSSLCFCCCIFCCDPHRLLRLPPQGDLGVLPSQLCGSMHDLCKKQKKHATGVRHAPVSHISLDFVTGLPTFPGKTVMLSIIDRFSKATHFVTLQKLPTASKPAVFRLDGI